MRHLATIPVTLALITASVITAVPPANAENIVRTFDQEPTGQPPKDTITRGNVTVAETPFGENNRAVRLVDSSTSDDSSALFDEPAASNRRWSFDLAPRQAVPFELIIHGRTHDGQPTTAHRLSIGPVYSYGRSAAAQVSIDRGGETEKWAVIPDLTDQDAPTNVMLTASPDALVLQVGHFVFRTATAASEATMITGLELASPGASATGVDVFLDNLAVSSGTDTDLAPGLSANPAIDHLVAADHGPTATVATIDDPSTTAGDVQAQVYVGGTWQQAVVTGRQGQLSVRARLTEPDIGLHPVTVTLTDRRTGVTRSTQIRTDSFSPIPHTVVTQLPEGNKEARFTDAVRTDDGRIVVVFHVADGHTHANGVIQLVSSADNGRTWTAPRTVLEGEYDNRDPKITQLNDGTLLLSVFRTDWNAGGANIGTFVLRSTDGGETFGEETKINSDLPGTYEHAPAVELEDGTILQPLYGSGARIARSTDGGRTFPTDEQSMIVTDTAEHYNREPNLVQLPSGEIVMLIRTYWSRVGAEDVSRIVRSFDGGRTWTAPELTDLPTSSHHMLLTHDGSVLLTFGNIKQPSRPTYASLITDPSGPWTGYEQRPVFHGTGGDDQGNPSSVELPNGSFLSFGYDVGQRTVVSWRTTPADYR
ncbi:sialidase family protein [Propionibacteriaceae bacterium Y1700]|uniref:sialidase family protein n=1 Tax=Microlunatus sp. Y1700 TaxID=3418487 RepID=UPI003DA702AE